MTSVVVSIFWWHDCDQINQSFKLIVVKAKQRVTQEKGTIQSVYHSYF